MPESEVERPVTFKVCSEGHSKITFSIGILGAVPLKSIDRLWRLGAWAANYFITL